MVEAYLRQSPLSPLGLGARTDSDPGEAAALLSERPFPTIVDLRGSADDSAFMNAVSAALGLTLPHDANTTARAGDLTALWLGPNEWWIIGQPEAPGGASSALAVRMAEALDGQRCAVIDVGESRTCIRISGRRARAVLQKGCPLDFHTRAFAPGQCAQSHLSKAPITIHLAAEDETRNGPAFDLYVLRSFADYVWRWLEDAGREYGIAVVTDDTPAP